jgi:hypothetical protein
MSNTFWIKDGKFVINATGFVVCDHCPCEDPCYEDVIAAIRERQIASGRTVWAEVPSPAKSLSQCIIETNEFALLFVGEPYDCNGTDLPLRCSIDYANDALDFCELYDLLLDLQDTYQSPDTAVSVYMPGIELSYGYDSDTHLPDAKATAEATFSYTGGVSLDPANAYSVRQVGAFSGSGWVAVISTHGWHRRVGTTTALTKIVDFYAKHGNVTEWDTWGHTGIPSTYDTYELIGTVDGGASEEVLLWCGDARNLPGTTWPAQPTVNNVWTMRGYGRMTGAFAIIHWGFTHVPP